MHDRKKVAKDPSAQTADAKAAARAAEQAKIAKYLEKVAVLQRLRAAHDHSERTLGLLDELQRENPEYSTLWAQRKEVVTSLLDVAREADRQAGGGEGAATPGKAEAQVLQRELKFNKDIIATCDPKSYCTWYHRKWVIRQGTPPEQLQTELALCELLLKHDERNFHCWGYRQWVTAKLIAANQYSAEKDLKYAQAKVETNFSNYSAWHQRALQLQASEDATVLAEELSYAIGALYTLCTDQTTWIYANWLAERLHSLSDDKQSSSSETAREALQAYRAAAEDILQDNPGPAAKWPLLTLANLAELVDRDAEAAKAFLRRASDADPARRGYYEWRIARSGNNGAQ